MKRPPQPNFRRSKSHLLDLSVSRSYSPNRSGSAMEKVVPEGRFIFAAGYPGVFTFMLILAGITPSFSRYFLAEVSEHELNVGFREDTTNASTRLPFPGLDYKELRMFLEEFLVFTREDGVEDEVVFEHLGFSAHEIAIHFL